MWEQHHLRELLTLLLLLACGARASLLASSTLTACTQTATSSDAGNSSTALKCSNELVVTLTVPTGQSGATQQLQAQLSSATTAGNSSQQLQAPLTISVIKSPVFAAYPLTYLQNFNSKPTELLIPTTNCVACAPPASLPEPPAACRRHAPRATRAQDGAYAAIPTCGWFTDASGANVPWSDGFCCACSASQTVQQTLGGGATAATRGNLDCNLFADSLFLTGVPATASCMRLSASWWSGFSVGLWALEFSITINITQASSVDGGPAFSETLTVSPAALVAVNAARSVSAELMGNLGGFAESPDLSDRILLIPYAAGGASASNASTWMLVPATDVSLDGSACDAIGTGFAAFAKQPDRCGSPVGSCLGNQIQDLYDADAARVKAGAAPLYYLSALGVGRVLDPAAAGENARLALPVTQLSNSVLTLGIAAQSLRWVVSVSPGRIVSASLVDFNGANASAFAALSGNGFVQVTVQNTGRIDAGFYISIVNCSAGVAVFDSTGLITIAAGALHTERYAASVQDDRAGGRQCTVELQDATFALLSSELLRFETNATQYTVAPSLGGGTAGGAAGPTPGMVGACPCHGFAAAACFVLHRCWGSMGKLFAAVLAPVAGLLLLWKLGALAAVAARLRGVCCGGGGEDDAAVMPMPGRRRREAARRQRTYRARAAATASDDEGDEAEWAKRAQLRRARRVPPALPADFDDECDLPPPPRVARTAQQHVASRGQRVLAHAYDGGDV